MLHLNARWQAEKSWPVPLARFRPPFLQQQTSWTKWRHLLESLHVVLLYHLYLSLSLSHQAFLLISLSLSPLSLSLSKSFKSALWYHESFVPLSSPGCYIRNIHVSLYHIQSQSIPNNVLQNKGLTPVTKLGCDTVLLVQVRTPYQSSQGLHMHWTKTCILSVYPA